MTKYNTLIFIWNTANLYEILILNWWFVGHAFTWREYIKSSPQDPVWDGKGCMQHRFYWTIDPILQTTWLVSPALKNTAFREGLLYIYLQHFRGNTNIFVIYQSGSWLTCINKVTWYPQLYTTGLKSEQSISQINARSLLHSCTKKYRIYIISLQHVGKNP